MESMAHERLGLVLRHLRQWIGARPAVADGSDGQLLERYVQHRDSAAFEALVQRYGPLVWGVCRRVLRDAHAVEDSFQATFVVLARKAASIRKHESVGSWLYGVAYRIAVRAKANAARRREVAMDDRALAAVPADAGTGTADQQELSAALDEELSRLPEKYRAPLVLCYLKGKTHAEAAAELRCPAGSMSWRLAQACDRLRVSLSRRGLALSAGALAGLLTESAASARVPAALVQHTIEAALNNSGLSAHVADLVTGVVQTMYAARIKMVAAVVLALGLIGSGIGVVAYRTLGRDAEPARQDTAIAKEQPAGPAVNGLKLSLTADKTETFMKADGSNAEPVKLTFTFTNVSDKPVKFNAFDFAASRIGCDVKPPDEQTIRVSFLKADRPQIQPVAADFFEIKPGQSWTPRGAISFPGTFSASKQLVSYNFAAFTVLKPGAFRLKVTYNSPHCTDPLADGIWTGTLSSNEIVLKVKPADEKKADAGPAVDGLTLSLSADKTETFMKADGSDAEPVKLKLTFTNASDKPIKLNAYDFRLSQIRGAVKPPDNQDVKVRRVGVDRAKLPPPTAGDFPVIQPGKTWAYELLTFPGPVPDGASMISVYTVLKPGLYRLTFTYKPVAGLTDEAKGSWSGELVSNELTIAVKPADEKKADAGPAVDGLTLSLSADKTETFMNAERSDAEPVKLNLTFTNVSDKPIKLNAFDFHWNRIHGDVQAPDNQSVKLMRLAAKRTALPAAAAGDFPVIPAGKTWVYEKDLAFPGSIPEGGATFAVYTVLKPGDFRLKFTYTPLKNMADEIARGSWTGELVSNEIVLKVKSAAGR